MFFLSFQSLENIKIIITGAAGFIGQLLAEILLNDENYTVVLDGPDTPPIPKGVKYPQNAKVSKSLVPERLAVLMSSSQSGFS
jgi:nucleoside-diphosphate-sugar epimerase